MESMNISDISRRLVNVWEAQDQLKRHISSYEGKIKKDLQRVLHIFEMEAFMSGDEIQLTNEDVELCLDFWPACFDGMEVKIS